MNITKYQISRWIVLAILMVVIAYFRYVPGAGDIYARNIYPIIGYAESAFTSLFPFHVYPFLFIAIYFAIVGIMKREFNRPVSIKTRCISVLALIIEINLWWMVCYNIGNGNKSFSNAIMLIYCYYVYSNASRTY